jgi:serine/threonine protein kinase
MKLGTYRLTKDEPIAEGGFAYIYQAEHTVLHQPACLKANKISNEQHVKLLLEEASILWGLDGYHSIPTLREVYVLDKEHAIAVLSYIEGQSLDTIVEQNGRVHAEDAAWITERLLGALHYVHRNGIVHGDVKPQNVLIEPEKRDIKLIDFTLAVKNPDARTAMKGYTDGYGAPEVIDGKPPLPESDLYGAGMVLLYALGGDPISKILPADVPRPLGDFCYELIRHDPLQRPSWERNNPLQRLSDIRYEVFGRRHIQ